ncbi:BRO-N domain-containing protein [Burkholderia stagnalis]|uniref:BRO-N domain-containing protein n=1 Tax=Burkholderia stagnalis TaxID=1503054 RepID=UPI000F5C7C94|nr:BRO family protein [Burkholderia stagnalis]RQY08787.1 hypothetical protein DF117_35725 [Burkholderia stagnalis]RQY87390.1 hypothetical protein DF106_34810 [Burkholderia stagnalis]RQY94657.1 hypothetical protein DF105_35155 [Burkholderia stagnalis]
MNLRAVERDGEPWFVAKDVCSAMGYLNVTQTVTDHVDADDKHIVSIGLPGRAPLLVNESGLYALILSSKKSEARAFRKWVTSEVLPSIRKHGMYMTQEVARLKRHRVERP